MQVNRRTFGKITLAAGAVSLPTKIDGILRTGIAQRKIPSVAGVAAAGRKTLYEGAFGVRDSSGTPVRLDAIFNIASMVKPITTAAAMQLVEQGKMQLDEPVSKHLPQLGKLEVLEGFDTATGKPLLRPAKTPVTLRHLLTHTSGLCYDVWHEGMFRYKSRPEAPSNPNEIGPLMFEPGTAWQYGTGVDWAGRLVEAVSGSDLERYLQTNIAGPLGMPDTSFLLPEAKTGRATRLYRRQVSGQVTQIPWTAPMPPKTFNGGGSIYSTAPDYLRFMQMILGKGKGVNGTRILREKTVESMQVNQIGELTAGKMKSYRPARSNDVDMQPGHTEKWGLGFLINTTPYEGGRSAGSLAWAGMSNTYFWIDPKRSVCGALMMQLLPFVDPEAMGLLSEFERAVYSSL